MCLATIRAGTTVLGRDDDDPGARPAFLDVVDLDADLAQEGRGAAQASGQCPRAGGPGPGLGDLLPRFLGKGAQKIRGSPRPLRPLRHHGAHRGGDGVYIQLEIFVGDARQFEALIPDDWFTTNEAARQSKADRLADFAETGLAVRRGDGTALPVRLKKVEARTRIDRTTALSGQRDPITGRTFPKPPDDPRVVYAELFYDFGGMRPDVIEISPPADAARTPLATIGMVVFDRGVPVTNFSYLSASARLTMDWNDPWYSRFDNVNLRRHHQSGVTTYLYIEPREVRHETLFRVRDIAPWIGLELAPGHRLSPDQQTLIKDRAAGLLAVRNPVSIDGNQVAPQIARSELLTIDTSGLQIVDSATDPSADTVFVGVILSFPQRTLPERVSVSWDMFSDQIQDVPASATDPAGPFRSGATPDDPEIVWNNHLLQYQNPLVTPLSTADVAQLQIPVMSVLGVLVGVLSAILFFTRRGTARVAMACLGVAGFAGAVLAVDMASLSVRNPVAKLPDAQEATSAFGALLININTAHLEISPEERARALAPLVTDRALQDVAAELERALAVRVPSGGIARVSQVGDLDLEELTELPNGIGFSALARWTAEANAAHWGHNHIRFVDYRALVEVIEEDGHWKLAGITVLEAKLQDG